MGGLVPWRRMRAYSLTGRPHGATFTVPGHVGVYGSDQVRQLAPQVVHRLDNLTRIEAFGSMRALVDGPVKGRSLHETEVAATQQMVAQKARPNRFTRRADSGNERSERRENAFGFGPGRHRVDRQHATDGRRHERRRLRTMNDRRARPCPHPTKQACCLDVECMRMTIALVESPAWAIDGQR